MRLLGGGSNIVVPDDGVAGVTMSLGRLNRTVRAWLAEFHAASPGIWLIMHKKRSPGTSPSYDDAVEEAAEAGEEAPVAEQADESVVEGYENGEWAGSVLPDDDGTGPALYAGGSRGDVYRLASAKGDVLWRTNVSEATNAFSD